MNKTYRSDIDGLRALAVISVIFFHLGYIPNGYLGVDIFFVISGYLITGIVYNEVEENKFSILRFYEKRVRRIIPLVLVTTLVAFILGLIFMLPDDLENLAQAVIATNFSANNILMSITSSDYWAIRNDYNPLMHTWSLGVEEQFYLLYPAIFFFLKGDKKKFILPTLTLLTCLSLVFFFTSNSISSKFYLLHYRFFELSIGGICAIYFRSRNLLENFSKNHLVLFFCLSLLVFILYSNSIENNDIKVLMTTVLTACVLVLGSLHFENNMIYKFLTTNKIFTGIGKISFSIYMWHQIVFAFSRYFLVETITLTYAVVLSLVVVLLSIMSYFAIENPFRNRSIIKTRLMFLIIGLTFSFIVSASMYVYSVGGIVKDVPELGMVKPGSQEQLKFHVEYNESAKSMDTPFTNSRKIKILVIGDSFGSDFTNILKESSFSEKLEISITNKLKPNDEVKERIEKADFIFYSTFVPSTKEEVIKRMGSINTYSNKLWIVGIKDFGNSNGVYYHRKNKMKNCREYRANMKIGYLEMNNELKTEWGDRYIDLITLIVDSEGKVLIFTDDCKFISQDAMHLTKFGAVFFAKLLDFKIRKILNLS